jgi:hypothetical protein
MGVFETEKTPIVIYEARRQERVPILLVIFLTDVSIVMN